MYADNGGGKTSVAVSIAQWFHRTKSNRKVHWLDTAQQYAVNTYDEIEPYVNHVELDIEKFDLWTPAAKKLHLHPDDVLFVDIMTHGWEGAQRYYWGQKSGNNSLAELWLKYSPQDIAGDHGTNWGIINKWYGEFRSAVWNVPCHVIWTATAKPVQEPSKSGKGGDDLATRNYYSEVGMKVEGQKDLRGDMFSVVYMFEANGKYRITTVKEMGPIGRVRERVVNKDITGSGFVPGYLIPVAGWRP